MIFPYAGEPNSSAGVELPFAVDQRVGKGDAETGCRSYCMRRQVDRLLLS